MTTIATIRHHPTQAHRGIGIPTRPALRPTRPDRRFLALLAGLLLLAGCAARATVTEVTVTAGDATVTLPAALSCFSPAGATELSCAGGEDDSNAPHLAVAPNTDVTIAVPQQVGDTPWVVVFTYTDAAGDEQNDRTAVFPPKEQFTYRLSPPAGAQLHRLEVQSLTAAPSSDGGVEFPAIGTWVLLIDSPGAGSATPATGSA